jgi:hypothetical protein
MTLQRADRLKELPVVGQWYLVPAILWKRGSHVSFAGGSEEAVLRELQLPGAKWWPVWGSKHRDVEHFGFDNLHYHIDPRFLTKRHWSEFRNSFFSRSPLQQVQAMPLNHVDLKSGPPKPQLRRMRCTMAHSEWGHADAKTVVKFNEAYDGQQCAKGKRGFICPHKLFPLGSVQAVDGVITCPLHGLRIDASTGQCLGAEA